MNRTGATGSWDCRPRLRWLRDVMQKGPPDGGPFSWCVWQQAHEPPYMEPYVRWCERTGDVNPPPPRFISVHRPHLHPLEGRLLSRCRKSVRGIDYQGESRHVRCGDRAYAQVSGYCGGGNGAYDGNTSKLVLLNDKRISAENLPNLKENSSATRLQISLPVSF
jgi:hypothetical protein